MLDQFGLEFRRRKRHLEDKSARDEVETDYDRGFKLDKPGDAPLERKVLRHSEAHC